MTLSSRKVFLVFLFIEVSFLRSEALECYSCGNIGDIQSCNSTVQCNTGESCHLSASVNGTGLFTLSCVQNEKCGSGIGAVVPVGKRQTKDCHECCSTDRCNIDLCSHLKPSACVDDEREDCAHLNSLFNICNDVAHAKLVCPKFCHLCTVVDGHWSLWSNWSSCDVTCGNGTQIRTRTCTNPVPARGGDPCVGSNNENKQCIKEICPIHGGWSKWSEWGSCSASCDIGLQRRDRTCSNPPPSMFGDNCYGDARDDRICIQSPCANGGWTHWTIWSACTMTCGGGIHTRSRMCSNPKPSILGQYCVGDPMQAHACNTDACQTPVQSSFSVFHPFNYSRFNGADKLTFSHIIYKYGGDFDETTGTFTCSIPGTYHFSVTLVRKLVDTGVKRIYCTLYKTGAYVILINVGTLGGGSDKGGDSMTQSVVVHLNTGDVVYLSGCSAISDMEYLSSFTGFLLYPDN